MSEWRYECSRCYGKFREWNRTDGEVRCPWCSLKMGEFDYSKIERWNHIEEEEDLDD